MGEYKTTAEDDKWLLKAFDVRDSITPPHYSQFRVVSIITYKACPVGSDEATWQKAPVQFVSGTNTETCFIGDSICSERCALGQLRLIPASTSIRLLKLYLVCDAIMYLSPGLLCRQMLCEFCPPDFPILMAYRKPNDKTIHVKLETLGELFPYRHLYLKVPNTQVANFAKKLAAQAQLQFSQPVYRRLYEAAMTTVALDNDKDDVHPVRYAAAILFENGQLRTCVQRRALEYGSTGDPMYKTQTYVDEFKLQNVRPSAVLQVDQWGILHAPSAASRVFFFEQGHAHTQVLFHDAAGKLIETTFSALVPDNCAVDVIFHDRNTSPAGAATPSPTAATIPPMYATCSACSRMTSSNNVLVPRSRL